ncbi:MAG: oxidoreductase [Campylobacter sp.]|uniref:phage tail protein n=1 Tax=Campylobacter sp. TaxID=205 RepID=UPI000A338304|nr:phage tail protein [Campylobacter sp.]MBE6429883.1 oxidoreductase [Campylobacter sp.]MBO5064038.1 phage tail protein [Campylobacter sp.]
MILSLGGFLFEVKNQISLNLETSSGIGSNERINNYPGHFRTTLGSSSLSIDGITLPVNGDGNKRLDKLYKLLDAGQSLALVGGDGKYYGRYYIASISEKRSIWTPNAKFLQQEFSVALAKVE